MQRTHDLVATIRRWKGKDGTEHKSTLTIGAVFVSTHGKQVLKLDAFPISPDFSGWVAMKPCGRKASPGMPSEPPDHDPQQPDPDSDIPF